MCKDSFYKHSRNWDKQLSNGCSIFRKTIPIKSKSNILHPLFYICSECGKNLSFVLKVSKSQEANSKVFIWTRNEWKYFCIFLEWVKLKNKKQMQIIILDDK